MAANKIELEGAGSLVVTEGAQTFMRRMVRFGGLGPGAGFRLVVTPGGCSGMSADFTVEQDPRAGDLALSLEGLRVFLPEASVKLLDGVTIDFSDTRMQQGLTFHHPNAAASCADTAPRPPPMVQLSSLVRG